jgi:hypothetical protein
MALLAAGLGLSMVFGVAAPAQAISIGGADDLWKYVQTIKGSQLQAASKIGQEAWTRNTARVAASNANLYTAGTIYGNFDPGDLAEVIPIDKPVDYAPGKRIRLGSGARGITLPAYQGSYLQKALGGIGGQVIAFSAFAFRADIANGVMSWFGQDDTNGLVCGTDFGGAEGIVNFITGQDCAMYEAAQEYIANSDVVEGVTGGWSCTNVGTQGRDVCIKLLYKETSASPYGGTGERVRYYFDVTIDGTHQNVTPDPYYLNQFGVWVRARATSAEGLTWNSAPFPQTPRGNLDNAYNSKLHSDRMVQYRSGAEGVAQEVTDVEADPERYFECRVHLSSGPVLTGVSAPFRESERALVEPNCPATPDGSTPILVEVYEVSPMGSTLVWSQEPTPEHLDYEEEFGEQCQERTCLLDLVQLSSGKSCFGLVDACDGWMTSPTRDADYACLYGGVSQPMQECYVYANVFNKQKRLAGNAWADPATGDDLGGSVSLRFDESLMGAPARSPDGIRACGGAGWGEPNPLEGVLRPIQCALEWAFVPRAAYVEAQGVRLTTALDEHAPGQLVNLVGGWSLDPSPMTGCRKTVAWSPADAFDTGTGQTVLWDVCPGSELEFLGTMSRTVVGVSFAVMVFLVLKRSVGKTVDS